MKKISDALLRKGSGNYFKHFATGEHSRTITIINMCILYLIPLFVMVVEIKDLCINI